jgi:predicted nucleic acid-binding protein
LAKRYVQEPGSEVSTLSMPEFSSAIGRKVRDRELLKESAIHALREFEHDWKNLFIKIPLTEKIALSASKLTIQYYLKGADAVHLETAITVDAKLFVASDQQLISVAEKVGLNFYDPTEGEFSICQAFKGEVVVRYFEPLITQHMGTSGSPFG